MKKVVFFSFLCLMTSLAGHAFIIHVPADFPTIQMGITLANPGDTVLISPGTYPELITFDGKDITVASLFLTTGDSAYIDQTIISAPSQGAVVTFENGESEAALLCGLTLMNGTGKPSGFAFIGGGIYCNEAHPRLDHLVIKNNSAGGFGGIGGGIYLAGSLAQITHCNIHNNEASMGGGIRCDGSNVLISECHIHDNFAVSSGGGVMFNQCNTPVLSKTLLTGNSGIYGGAISCYHSHPLIERVTTYRNTGGYGGTINAESNSNPKVLNCIFWQNSMDPVYCNEIFLSGPGNIILIAYSDIRGGDTAINMSGASTVQWMEKNIQEDPQFTDTLTLDLTLAEGSPCIDAGTPVYVYYGDTILDITNYYGTAPDMGAFEFVTTVSSKQPPTVQSTSMLRMLNGTMASEKQISLTLPDAGWTELRVFDLQGRCVAQLAAQQLMAGEHRFTWQAGSAPHGIYFIQVITPSARQAIRIVH